VSCNITTPKDLQRPAALLVLKQLHLLALMYRSAGSTIGAIAKNPRQSSLFLLDFPLPKNMVYK
jgi:hypothetical protein